MLVIDLTTLGIVISNLQQGSALVFYRLDCARTDRGFHRQQTRQPHG
jgi:hypothetical protein